jgi:hypothetical protein
MAGAPHPWLGPLLSCLAEDAVAIQRRLDAAATAALLRYCQDSAALPAWLADSLAPPVLRARRFEIDVELAVARSREFGGGIGLLPVGPAFFARHGTRREAAAQLSVVIEALLPAPPVSAA